MVSGLYFYFNETTGDLVYSDKATYSGDGYTSLGEQTNTAPSTLGSWVFDSKRASIKTVTKDAGMTSKIDVLTRMSSMFYNCSALTSLDLSGFDTSNVTNVSQMFSGCTALASLDLSGFDTSSLTDISSMFFGCTALTSLDLSSFNTSNVTDMGGMFKDCQSLTSLDLSGFDTSNVTKMGGMFRGCQSLTSLDLSSFDTSNVIAMYEMFYGCSDLTSLDLSSFDTSKATNTLNMFNNCNNLRIIDISPNMSNTLSSLPADTYYDAVTRQSYTKDTIPGGSTYVRDLADLDLVATMVQTRMGINKVKGMLNEVRDLKKQVDASLQQIQSLQDSLSHLVLGTHITKVEFAYQDEEDWSWEVRLFNDAGGRVYIGFRKDRIVLWDGVAQRVIWTIRAQVSGPPEPTLTATR